jgi:hypothetical protein
MKQLDKIDQKLDQIQESVDNHKLAGVAFNAYLKATPKDTGFAKRNTRLSGFDIYADYPYSVYLEKGYSPQAPDGMLKEANEAVKLHIEKQQGETFKGN